MARKNKTGRKNKQGYQLSEAEAREQSRSVRAMAMVRQALKEAAEDLGMTEGDPKPLRFED